MLDVSQQTGFSDAGIAHGTRIAVTGATGFVGGRLVEVLARAGADITCLIRGSNAGTRLHRAGARIRKIDLADMDAVSDALRGINLVFHLAYDWGDTAWNFAALRALIRACQVNNCARLVYASSFVVYDLPEEGEVSETTRQSPASSGYAHTKMALEAQLLQAVNDAALPATIVQPTIIYGPHSRPWTVEPAEMLRFGTVILPQGGTGICNAVYVDDVVHAMMLAAVNPRAIGQRYLISGPSVVTWNEFYETIAETIGAKGPRYLPTDVIERSHGRSGKIRKFATDPNFVIHRTLQIGPLRKLARLSLRALPRRLRQTVQDRWMGDKTRLPGHTHMPNAGHLQFLLGRAIIMTTKAQEELGYAPVFHFGDGMRSTSKFLIDHQSANGACD